MKLTIKQLVAGAMIGVAVSSTISIGAIYYGMGKIAQDGNLVNYAGRQRALSQKLAKAVVTQISAGKDLSKEIANTVTSMDGVVLALKEGSTEAGVPKTDDAEFRAKQQEVEDHWQTMKAAVASVKAGDPASVEAFYAASEKVLKAANDSTYAAAALSEGKVKALKLFQVAVMALTLVGLAILWWAARRFLLSPLDDTTRKIGALSDGQLTVDFSTTLRNELGDLMAGAGHMAKRFNGLIGRMAAGLNNVAATSNDIRAIAHRNQHGATQQSLQAQEIAAATEELSQSIGETAQSTAEAVATAETALNLAESSKEMVGKTAAGMRRAHQNTMELASAVENLHSHTDEIGGVVTTIKEIADLTNLLALNASIEAARAGEQGRGFAVVADEVRNLASRTLEATTRIAAQIEAVQAESARTAGTMRAATREVDEASGFIQGVEQALDGIVEAIKRAEGQISLVSNAMQEQAAASEQIASTIAHSASIAQETETGSNHIMERMKELVHAMEDIRAASSSFKIGGLEMLELAKSDHKAFVSNIRAHVHGVSAVGAAALPDHHNCRFGKWYDAAGADLCGHTRSYRLIDAPHAKLHALSREAAMLMDSGRKEEAERVLSEIEKLSEEVIGHLSSIQHECDYHHETMPALRVGAMVAAA